MQEKLLSFRIYIFLIFIGSRSLSFVFISTWIRFRHLCLWGFMCHNIQKGQKIYSNRGSKRDDLYLFDRWFCKLLKSAQEGTPLSILSKTFYGGTSYVCVSFLSTETFTGNEGPFCTTEKKIQTISLIMHISLIHAGVRNLGHNKL